MTRRAAKPRRAGATVVRTFVSPGVQGLLAALLLTAAAQVALARTAQVCPGPALPPSGCFTIDTSRIGDRAFEDYVVTRPGKLLFDVERRRSQLATLDPSRSARYCAVSPYAALARSLPTVQFSHAAITLWESRWSDAQGSHVRQYAKLSFEGLTNADGTAYPLFGLTFNKQNDDPTLRLEFFPSDHPNLAGIPGLDRDVYLNVDPVAGENRFQRLDDLPAALRTMILALAYRLPSIVALITNVTVQPGAVGSLWDVAGVAQAASTFSAVGFGTPAPAFAPIVTLNCDLDGLTCAETADLIRFRDFLIQYGADYLASADPGIGGVLLSNLRHWAQNDALSSYKGIVIGASGQKDFRPKYELQWFLVPALQTWSLVRNDALVPLADRALIDTWFERRIAYATEPFGGPGSPENPFNVGYLVRGLKMALGIVTANHTSVAEGAEKVLMGLHQMRADGSFPREVARGACALRYQDTMLLNLMLIAELAAVQGYDLYSLSVNGKSLHTAVKFLLDAVDDPSVVLGYAAEDAANCTGALTQPLDKSAVVEAPGGFNYSAWLEPYIARFPDHPNSPRLRALLNGGLDANRPIHHAHAGGNTTCFSAAGTPSPITGPGTAVEYFNAAFEHYFVTDIAGELDTLDAGGFTGWRRTGETFRVSPLHAAGKTDVCRFFSTAFGPKSSHFYAASAIECAAANANPDWQFEGMVFAVGSAHPDGTCAAGSVPLYRLYNDGRSGAPNHRYTQHLATRASMLQQGYVPEGFGPLGVVACVAP